MKSESIGARIRQTRLSMGLDAQQLATRISVKTSTLEKWERGERAPRANKLVMLAGILGVSTLWLLDGEVPANADYDVRLGPIGATARKLERAMALQAELAAILSDLSADVSRLRQTSEPHRDAAA